MTPPPNLPAGLRSAVEASLPRDSSKKHIIAWPTDYAATVDALCTALSPFWPGQSAPTAENMAVEICELLHGPGEDGDLAFAADVSDVMEYLLKHAPRTDAERQVQVFARALQNIPKSFSHLETGDAIKAMGSDADRYAFLRAGGCEAKDPERGPCLIGLEVVRFRTNEYSEPDYEKLEGEELDQAIDAAMIAPTQPDSNKERI